MIISPDPSHLLLCRPLLTSGQPITLHTHGLGWVVILLSGLCMLIWAVSPQWFLLYCFARDRRIGCPLCRRPDTSRSLLKVKTSVHSSSKSEKMCQKLCYNGESLHPHFIVERIQAYTDFFLLHLYKPTISNMCDPTRRRKCSAPRWAMLYGSFECNILFYILNT
jgi:hypothetical protein